MCMSILICMREDLRIRMCDTHSGLTLKNTKIWAERPVNDIVTHRQPDK